MHSFTSIAIHCTLNPITCLMYVVNREEGHEAVRMQQSRGFEVLTVMSWYHSLLVSDAL